MSERSDKEHVDLAETMDGIVADLENENRKLRARIGRMPQ